MIFRLYRYPHLYSYPPITKGSGTNPSFCHDPSASVAQEGCIATLPQLAFFASGGNAGTLIRANYSGELSTGWYNFYALIHTGAYFHTS